MTKLEYEEAWASNIYINNAWNLHNWRTDPLFDADGALFWKAHKLNNRRDYLQPSETVNIEKGNEND